MKGISSMTIYLYVKTHSVTGLKYFGKTIQKDPYKYSGSGVYWLAHLKSHGSDFTTEIVGTFESQEEATEFALDFSRRNDIVSSDKWANLVEEDAQGGGKRWTESQRLSISQRMMGHEVSVATREKMSLAARNISLETRERMAEAQRGKKASDETRRKLSAARMGHSVSDETREKIRSSKTGVKRNPLSKETRDKMSASRTGVKRGPMSDHTKKLISIAAQNRTLSKETREQISKSMSKKRWITDGVKSNLIDESKVVPAGWYYGRTRNVDAT
jgi:hypothetical protein